MFSLAFWQELYIFVLLEIIVKNILHMEKIQELTEKIYSEGVERGRQEADRIIAEAQEKAQAIIAEAQQKAKNIQATAERAAAELDANTRN